MLDSTPITDSEYLFAQCITDGMLEEMNEAQRKSIILVIRHIMKKNPLTDSDCKNSLKVSK